MGAYPQGTTVVLHALFELPDGTPADPATVTFRVRAPDGTLASYLYGTAPQVTRLAVGSYQCQLLPALLPLPGEYHSDAVGTGPVTVVLTDDFTVIASSVVPPPTVSGPQLGPCASWIAGPDVQACCPAAAGIDTDVLDAVAVEASMALYEISGRQFTGLCSRVVRPQAQRCGCWGASSGLPFYWTLGPSGIGSWGWWSEGGDRRGCNPMSVVRLAGYPVRQVTSVKIDGAVLAAVDAHGNPNYRLDKWRELVRMADPGPPYQQRFWPACQNMDLDSSQPGTFEVSYLWGVDPPQLGRDAATQLACQLYAACPGSGQACALPAGVTKIVRQGVEVDRALLANWFDKTKSTGLVHVDLFLKAYGGMRAGRRSAVWSPDVPGFARTAGN